MLCKKIRQYLIDFLVGSLWVQSEGDDRFQRRFEAIGYTDDPEQMKLYPIVIIPSGFFKMDVYGTEESMPTLPLKTWRGIPLLFGEPREEWSADGSQLIICADLLASTYFLIPRYEECTSVSHQYRDRIESPPQSLLRQVSVGAMMLGS